MHQSLPRTIQTQKHKTSSPVNEPKKLEKNARTWEIHAKHANTMLESVYIGRAHPNVSIICSARIKWLDPAIHWPKKSTPMLLWYTNAKTWLGCFGCCWYGLLGDCFLVWVSQKGLGLSFSANLWDLFVRVLFAGKTT